MICAQLHRGVDVLRARLALCVNTDCLVDHRDKDSVYNESGSLAYLYRCLADLGGNRYYAVRHFLRSVQSCNDLNQLHNRSRVEEVHTYNVMLQACGNLGDGKGGGVGGEDTLRFADLVQLPEGLSLDIHVLHSRLYDQIAVAADLLCAGLDLCNDPVGVLFRHLALGHSLLKSLGNSQFSVCCELLVDVA